MYLESADTARNIREQSKKFKDKATRLKWKFMMRKYGLFLIIGFVILAIMGLRYLL